MSFSLQAAFKIIQKPLFIFVTIKSSIIPPSSFNNDSSAEFQVGLSYNNLPFPGEIALLRVKQHIFTINSPDKDICQPDFIERADIALQAVRPFVNYMSEVLTTNAAGESLG